MVFFTYRIVEDRDLNEESNDNLEAENDRHLNNDKVIQLVVLSSFI